MATMPGGLAVAWFLVIAAVAFAIFLIVFAVFLKKIGNVVKAEVVAAKQIKNDVPARDALKIKQ